MNREIHVELLLGRKVVDSCGAFIGRVEEMECDDGRITAVLTGREALLQRLWGLHRMSKKRKGCRVPWDRLTWPEAGPLKTTCPQSELEAI